MSQLPSVDPKVIREIEADALKQQARLSDPEAARAIEAKEAARARLDVAQLTEVESAKTRAPLDPQVVRDVQAEALEQQARLSRARPTEAERHGLRRWLHRA